MDAEPREPDIVIRLDAMAASEPLRLDEIFPDAGTPVRPIELELGCGKGRFLVEAAGRWPDRDFIAVELAGSLIRKVRDRVVRLGLRNVRLVHGRAQDALGRIDPPARVRRVHAYFPDPWPKRRHAKHRLFAGRTADRIADILAPGGQLLFATDSDPYFREVIASLGVDARFVRILPDVFGDIPRGGFDAIFERAGVPVFRGAWERRIGG